MLTGGGTLSGVFNDYEALETKALAYSGSGSVKGVYYTPNPLSLNPTNSMTGRAAGDSDPACRRVPARHVARIVRHSIEVSVCNRKAGCCCRHYYHSYEYIYCFHCRMSFFLHTNHNRLTQDVRRMNALKRHYSRNIVKLAVFLYDNNDYTYGFSVESLRDCCPVFQPLQARLSCTAQPIGTILTYLSEC